jgi:uncharacterized membrane protein YhaH (DUF805 family)
MGFGQAISAGFSNYVNFRDRACRSEYWFWVLFYFLGAFVTLIIDFVLGIQVTNGPFWSGHFYTDRLSRYPAVAR